MIMIAGYTLTEASKRDAAVDGFVDLVIRARECEGCVDLSIAVDSVDATRINIFELWQNQQALDAWQKVANPPTVESKGTDVKFYQAEPAGNSTTQ